MEDGAAAATVIRELSFMSVAISKAIKIYNCWIPEHPIKNSIRPKEPAPRNRRLEDDEYDRLKEYCKGAYGIDAYRLILEVAFNRLNLRILRYSHAKSNKASEYLVRLFKYTKIGEYKNFIFIDGQYEDVVVGMLDRKTWLKRNTPQRLANSAKKQ